MPKRLALEPAGEIFAALAEILDDDFTGQIVLHCNQGHVLSYDVNRKGIRLRNGVVDLEEAGPVPDRT